MRKPLSAKAFLVKTRNQRASRFSQVTRAAGNRRPCCVRCGTHSVIRVVQYSTAAGTRYMGLRRKGICERCMKSPELISMSEKQLIGFIRRSLTWAQRSSYGSGSGLA